MSGQIWAPKLFLGIAAVLLLMNCFSSTASPLPPQAVDPSPPSEPVKLIFIHHSTGENWLADDNGGLGLALRDNHYFVSDTNYGWGPDCIGDRTDIGNWWEWFRGPGSSTYLSALYAESDQHSSYSRLADDPGGPNEIVMFKSCFPNSNLQGDPDDPVPPINQNPLRGQGSGSEFHTVANAKGIYLDLLEYFKTRQDRLFVVITAPPVQDDTWADNARAFNDWLVNDWLDGYPYHNVAVFDFYNVLTTNGGDAHTNDLGQESGNHHRLWHGLVQHKTDGDDDDSPNVLEYPTDDDHPSQAGNLKATGELVTLLNLFYNRWRQSSRPTIFLYLPLILKTGWWQPPVHTTWQWQLTDLPIDPSFDVEMYDIDLFDNDAGTVAALHAQGRKVICYISVGSWEEWRPDADQFPASVLGNDYEGWPGEKWLDIRQIDLLAPIMRARFDQCKAKGFDGIEPDNIDGYTNDTGFPLTYQDQLAYNLWLANEAHARGLSIGLKNDGDQVADLLPYFDWALTEDCFAQDWCQEVGPFVAAGKAVFAAEYTDEITLDRFLNQVCPQAAALKLSAILKNRDLDAWRRACP